MSKEKKLNNINENMPENNLDKVSGGVAPSSTPDDEAVPSAGPDAKNASGKNEQAPLLPEDALGEVTGGVGTPKPANVQGHPPAGRPMPLYGVDRRPPITVKYGIPDPNNKPGREDSDSDEEIKDNPIEPVEP